MRIGAAVVVAVVLLTGDATDVESQTTSPWNPFLTNAAETELAARARGVPFVEKPLVISSIGNYFSVVGRFVGKTTVFQDSIAVVFDTLFATRVHHGGPVQPTRLDSIRVGVGVATATSWNPVDNSEALQIERVMPVGARVTLPRSRFVLPHARAESDSTAWIVVTFHLTVGKPGDAGYHSDATTYAHSARGILSLPPQLR